MTHAGASPNPLWLLTGPLMVLVAMAPIIYWRRRLHVGFRWFLAGAGVWTVGVALKFICAGITYDPLKAIWASPAIGWSAVLMFVVWSGALTGIFENGTTLAAGWRWRTWASEPDRAVAIGLGAGGLEALTGIYLLVVSLASLRSHAELQQTLSYLSTLRVAATLPWLVMPVERIVATAVHTGFRTLTLYSVATRRLRFFWYGFLISSGIDGFAGWFLLTGRQQYVSNWWAVLGYLLFALVSIPSVIWCCRHWPADAVSGGLGRASEVAGDAGDGTIGEPPAPSL